MSRCFPFPPPGYEKKARADDADLLKKEDREKKHEGKKDKEKREGKEKREKDRSDGKQRVKEDRKEKHRDKKKDKKERNKDKDNDKNSISEEKRIAGQCNGYNGEKISEKEKQWNKDKNNISDERKQALQLQGHNREMLIQNIVLAEGTGDSNFVQELGRRIRDEEQETGSQLFERLPGTKWKNEKKQVLQLQDHHGEKPIQNSLLAEVIEDSTFLLEFGRRISDEEQGFGRQSVERLLSTNRKNDKQMDRVVVKDTGILARGNKKEKRVDNRKIKGQDVIVDATSSGSAAGQSFAAMVQNGVGLVPMEKNIEKKMVEKEKSKEWEGEYKQGEKRKDKEREKKSHRKDKEEKKKEEKVKEKSEYKNNGQDKYKNINKNDHLGNQNVKTSDIAKDGDRNIAPMGNFKKRKGLEANGFLHDADAGPYKMPRHSCPPLTENGRKLEPCQTPILFTSDRRGLPNNLKADSKEHKTNGAIETQPLTSSSKKSTSASIQAAQIAQASMKPPHPDSKYLSHLLSIPKIAEWSDFDDQEWLFSSKVPLAMTLDVGSAGAIEKPSVWAEALQIESADVCALPYVIPY